jgi:hypothetical protein
VHLLYGQGAEIAGFDIESDESWLESPGSFFRGSADSIAYSDNSFETVYSFEVLEHLEHPEVALREMRRVSARNVLITVPDCEVPSEFRTSGLTYNHFSDPTHIQFFTEKTLRELFLSAGLDLVYIKRINLVRPERLYYASRGYPQFLASSLTRIAAWNPFAKKFYMTLMALGVKSAP